MMHLHSIDVIHSLAWFLLVFVSPVLLSLFVFFPGLDCVYQPLLVLSAVRLGVAGLEVVLDPALAVYLGGACKKIGLCLARALHLKSLLPSSVSLRVWGSLGIRGGVLAYSFQSYISNFPPSPLYP